VAQKKQGLSAACEPYFGVFDGDWLQEPYLLQRGGVLLS
jgi:hypothetical protein